jgi:RNA polymerase sigma-70 factor (ECF subfamily)
MSTLTSVEELPFRAAVKSVAVAREPRTDHVLLEAMLAGDHGAFEELVSRYRNQITCYLYRMTDDYDGAVDLAQETFVRVFKAADRYQSTYAFSTYIYRIATNLAISELRKRKRRRFLSLSTFFRSEDGGADEEFSLPDERPLQDAVLVDCERRAAVTKAITTLPDKYRAPLVLRDVEGKSYEEIACILRTNTGTVKSRISRARCLLKHKLSAYM